MAGDGTPHTARPQRQDRTRPGLQFGIFLFQDETARSKARACIDHPTRIEQAKFVAEVLRVPEVELRAQNVYDFVLTNTTQFDYVLFLGLFYHLRHPLLVLDRVAELTREKLLFETQIFPPPLGTEPFVPQDDYPLSQADIFERPEFPRMAFVEKSVNADSTNWWFPTEACVFGMLRSAGFPRSRRQPIDYMSAKRRSCRRATILLIFTFKTGFAPAYPPGLVVGGRFPAEGQPNGG